MKRVHGTIVILLSLGTALPALAADYPDLRPAYDDQWEQSEDSLRFEAGVRYWYSWGQQYSQLGGDEYYTNDRSHILEGHFRIEDDYTSTFLKGLGGYAGVITGEHLAGDNAPSTFEGGNIGYAGGDFGWTPFGSENLKFGALVGYQYNRDSPDRSRLDVEHISGLDIHSLRLGATGRAKLGDMIDFDVEGVLVPYAFAYGATAELPFADQVVQGVTVNRRSTIATGALYGASGQAMLGIHPTENLTIRVGGRAWYLTGPSSTQEKMWEASTPESYLYSDQELNGFSLLRYGALAEVTGRF